MKFGKLNKLVKAVFVWPVLWIVLLAAGLRLFQNTVVPPSPYWEEVALGYDTYSILKTGHDHHGNFLPIVAFPSFGDFKPSLYFYSLVPSIALFGLNVWAVRLPAVLFSSLTVGVLYLLMKKWTNSTIAAWSAFLLAIQPWSWQVGRVGFEVNLAVFLLTLGVWALDNALDVFTKDNRTKRSSLRPMIWWSLLAAGSLALSMYSYHGARLLAPLFGFVAVLIKLDWQSIFKKPQKITSWLPAVILGIVLLVPLLLSVFSPSVQQRFAETSVFSDPQPVLQSNYYREQADNSWWSRVIYHRYVFWGEKLATNYLEHFGPSFLFTEGDSNRRHTSGYFGALYPWEAITLLVGAATAWQVFKNKRSYWLLLALTLLSPVAAALTTATPHALRALPLSVWLSGWSAIGLVSLVNLLVQNLLKKKLLVSFTRSMIPIINSLTIVFCLISMGVLWVYYRYQYRVVTANEWQYGYQEVISTLQNQARPDELIFLSRELGRPAMFVFFYTKADPMKVQAEEHSVTKDQQEFLEYENWRFVDGQRDQVGLHASSPIGTPGDVEIIDQIIGLDGQVVWNVYRK